MPLFFLLRICRAVCSCLEFEEGKGVFVGGRAKLGGWSALQSGWAVSLVTGSDRRYRSSLDCCRALVT